MKKATLFIIPALMLLLLACASKKAMINSSAADGSSFDKAIVIKETSEKSGVDAEYIWIAKHYPGAKTHSQSLNYHDKRPYDILHFTTVDGKEMTAYFDISNFYGKF